MQALSNPQVAFPLLGVGVGLQAANWVSARYGDYSGLISPETALSMLEEQNSALIDIRCCSPPATAWRWCSLHGTGRLRLPRAQVH